MALAEVSQFSILLYHFIHCHFYNMIKFSDCLPSLCLVELVLTIGIVSSKISFSEVFLVKLGSFDLNFCLLLLRLLDFEPDRLSTMLIIECFLVLEGDLRNSCLYCSSELLKESFKNEFIIDSLFRV